MLMLFALLQIADHVGYAFVDLFQFAYLILEPFRLSTTFLKKLFSPAASSPASLTSFSNGSITSRNPRSAFSATPAARYNARMKKQSKKKQDLQKQSLIGLIEQNKREAFDAVLEEALESLDRPGDLLADLFSRCASQSRTHFALIAAKHPLFDPNHVYNRHDNPLTLAVKAENFEAIAALLERGAKLSIQRDPTTSLPNSLFDLLWSWQRCPLGSLSPEAEEKKYLLAELVCELGADPAQPNVYGASACDFAINDLRTSPLKLRLLRLFCARGANPWQSNEHSGDRQSLAEHCIRYELPLEFAALCSARPPQSFQDAQSCAAEIFSQDHSPALDEMLAALLASLPRTGLPQEFLSQCLAWSKNPATVSAAENLCLSSIPAADKNTPKIAL